MIADDVRLGPNVVIHQPGLVNLYGCAIGDGTKVGAFCGDPARSEHRPQLQNLRAIRSSVPGVTIEDGVFVGHGVMFVNDRYPSAVNLDGSLQTDANWTLLPDSALRKLHRWGAMPRSLGE